MSNLWELNQVALRGRGALWRLEDICLRVRPGVTAVIGYSGAGKTSLLNLLVGYESPHSGKIVGRPQTAWAPQYGGLWPHLTVREHLRIAGPATAESERMDLLAAFDLAGRLDSLPDELSEGEQSRLAVARALVIPAAVLVMDEPLVHVDPARAEACWEVIRQRLAASGASLIFTTHSPEEALANAARAVCLKEGKLLHESSVDDLYWRPPSPELARFLGPANWFEPAEARKWLDAESTEAICRRPEQIEILPAIAPEGFIVEAARFCGSVAEADLRDPQTGAARRVYHRPSGRHLRAGERVQVRALS